MSIPSTDRDMLACVRHSAGLVTAAPCLFGVSLTTLNGLAKYVEIDRIRLRTERISR
jgi:hypothetical protein